jgi:glyoxylase-like metal-dependent hydrolase (beta-lactamase superfamily II)
MPGPTFRHALILATTCWALLAAPAAIGDVAGGTAAAIEVQRLRPGLHLLSGAGCNVVAWTGPDGLVLVDSGKAEAAPQLVEAVARIAPRGTRFLFNTHWHPDHTGGNALLGQAGALAVSQENVRLRMAEPQDLREYGLEVPAAAAEALPVVTFADSLVLNMNGDRLELLHAPAAHTDGDGIAWWVQANVVHLGDVFYAGGYPFIDTGSGGSLAGLVAAVETVLSRADARTLIVPGHGPVSTRAELAGYRDMLVAVGRRVRELAEQGRNLEEVLAAEPTAAFDARYGAGGVSAERFVRLLFEDLSGRR